ncbi:MAG: TetR/AcrR family transcriptional regulator [Planctomycetota bacterium]|nr:MAG: TetR/AcrR family transcriptional regulator [Planctomycetota bacterium]
MRYPEGHKDQTRERIIESAARVFRERGYAAGGVSAVMEGAGMTKGGFYAHFDSKEHLLAATLAWALESRYQRLTEGLSDDDPAWLAEVIRRYLSQEHFAHAEAGCPVPALLSELHRAGAEPREAFEAYSQKLSGVLASHLGDGDAEARQDQAIAILATLVGGMALARAVNDPAIANRTLDACREFLLAALPEKNHESATAKAANGHD